MNARSILIRYTVHQVVHWFMIGIILPVLTLFMMNRGMNLFQVGVAGACFSAAVLLFELPTGGLADAVGRRKVYIYSLFASLGGLCIWLIPAGFLFVTLGFILIGVGRALSSGTLDAWFVDELKKAGGEDNIQPYLAKAGIFIPIGIGLGTLTGGIIPQYTGPFFQDHTPFGMYGGNIAVQFAVGVIQLILTFILIKEAPRKKSSRDRNKDSSFSGILKTAIRYGFKHRPVLLFLCAMGALGFGLSGLEQFWQPRFKDLLGTNFNTIYLGLISAGYFFTGSVGNMLSIPLSRLFKHNYPLILFLMRLLTGIFLLVLSLQAGAIGFTIFYFAFFCTVGIANSPELAFFNSQIPDNTRSSLLSLLSFFLQVGGMTGLLIQGFIAETYSIALTWGIAGGVLFASSFLFLGTGIKKGRNPSLKPLD